MGSHSNAIFSYRDEDLDVVVSWLPHPSLAPGIRKRVVDAVGQLPRAWLVPRIEIVQFCAGRGGSITRVFSRSWLSDRYWPRID